MKTSVPFLAAVLCVASCDPSPTASFLVGQTQGNDVEHVNLDPEIELHEYADILYIDIDGHHSTFENVLYEGPSTYDFRFQALFQGGNTMDVIFLVHPIGNNKVAIDTGYQRTADSMLYSQVDPRDTDNLPNPAYFRSWVAALKEGDDLTAVNTWHDSTGTLGYWYKRDNPGYGSPLYGQFYNRETAYVGLLFYNRDGFPIYCWLRVQLLTDRLRNNHRLILKEYGYAPKYG